MIIAKKVIKKYFNKNLVMSEKDEQVFHSSKKCWICDKLCDPGDDKIRNHRHITGRYRGSVHWNCSFINFKNLSGNDFKYLSEEFSGDLLELMKQKGVYPYEYMDSFKKFSLDKSPGRCKFFSFLKDEYINEKDYSHAINV